MPNENKNAALQRGTLLRGTTATHQGVDEED
jgi:hypothetical protein